jgi:hypothetical protein
MVEFAHFNRDEEEFPMTEDRLLIEELAAKGGQPDFLRTIAENVLQLIMEADVDGPDRRGSPRTQQRARDLAQRLSRPFAGYPGRHAEPENPQAACWVLLSGLP